MAVTSFWLECRTLAIGASGQVGFDLVRRVLGFGVASKGEALALREDAMDATKRRAS